MFTISLKKQIYYNVNNMLHSARTCCFYIIPRGNTNVKCRGNRLESEVQKAI